MCLKMKRNLLDWIFSSWIATSFVMTGSDCMSMFRINSVTVSRVYGYSSPHFASENRPLFVVVDHSQQHQHLVVLV